MIEHKEYFVMTVEVSMMKANAFLEDYTKKNHISFTIQSIHFTENWVRSKTNPERPEHSSIYLKSTTIKFQKTKLNPH